MGEGVGEVRGGGVVALREEVRDGGDGADRVKEVGAEFERKRRGGELGIPREQREVVEAAPDGRRVEEG